MTDYTGKDGFTLMEVILAMAILSISLVMVMQLFSAGLRSSRTSCDYTRAIVHAKDKMENLVLTLTSESGEFEDGYRWETEAEPYGEGEDGKPNLLKVKVKINWPDRVNSERYFELVSLKSVESKDEM